MSSSVRTASTPLAGVGEALGEDASARRHGRPLDVRPLQVVAGFLESDRGRRDSGVCGMSGIEILKPVVVQHSSQGTIGNKSRYLD